MRMKKLNLYFTILALFPMTSLFGQPDFGNNSVAGKYVDSNGTKIYYESYGEGTPLVLLHGALFGYIDEYSKHIPHLIKHFKVIAIATRGHGKSFIGTDPFSFDILAKDVKAVLDKEGLKSASILGFSTGANVARYFNARYPDRVIKLVSMAGGVESSDQAIERIKKMSFSDFEASNKKFVAYRKTQMPEPDRYPEVIENLKLLWLDKDFLKKDALASVRNPVLYVIGDRDDYYNVEQFVEMYRNTHTGRLCVSPNRNHVGLLLDETVLLDVIIPFLLEK